jgi:hypothetical protein
MLLLKLPVPVPLLVLVLNEISGFCAVPHTTPRAVTLAPPSELMSPPLLAPLVVTPLTTVVVRVGGAGAVVVKDIWLPYAVPAELVAYPLA